LLPTVLEAKGYADVNQTRKLFVFSLWEFRRILLAISDDWLLDFRAMSLLVVTQTCLVLSALELGELTFGRRLIPSGEPGATAFALCFALAITAFNYYAISRENYWKQYEPEFDRYSNTIKTIGWLILITMLVIAGSMAIWLIAAVKALPR
jgi:hypothetical protein